MRKTILKTSKYLALLICLIIIQSILLASENRIEVPFGIAALQKYLDVGEHTISANNFINDISNYVCYDLDNKESDSIKNNVDLLKEYLEVGKDFLQEFQDVINNESLLISISNNYYKDRTIKFFNYFGVKLDKNDLSIAYLSNDDIYIKRRKLLKAIGYNYYNLSMEVLKKSIKIEIKNDSIPININLASLNFLTTRVDNKTFLEALTKDKKLAYYVCAITNLTDSTLKFIENNSKILKNVIDNINNFYVISEVLRVDKDNLHYPGGNQWKRVWLSITRAVNDETFLINILESKNIKIMYLFKVLSYMDDETVNMMLPIENNAAIDQLRISINNWKLSRTSENKIRRRLLVKDDIFDVSNLLYGIDEGKYIKLAQKILSKGFTEIKTPNFNLTSCIELASLPSEFGFRENTISFFLHLYSFYKNHPIEPRKETIQILKYIFKNYHIAIHYLQDICFTDNNIINLFYKRLKYFNKIYGSSKIMAIRMFQANLEYLASASKNGIISCSEINILLNDLIKEDKNYKIYTEKMLDWFVKEFIFSLHNNLITKDSSLKIKDPLMKLILAKPTKRDIFINNIAYEYNPYSQKEDIYNKILLQQGFLNINSIIELWEIIQKINQSPLKNNDQITKEKLINLKQIIENYPIIDLPSGISEKYKNIYLTDFRKSIFLKKIDKIIYSQKKDYGSIKKDLNIIFNEIASETMMAYVYLGAIIFPDSLLYEEKNLLRKHQFEYDNTIDTLSESTCNPWLNTYFGNVSYIGSHLANSLYGLKFVLPEIEARSLVSAENNRILNYVIYNMPFANNLLFNPNELSSIKCLSPIMDIVQNLLKESAFNDALKNVIINSLFSIIGNQRTNMVNRALMQNDINSINRILSPSDKLFLFIKLSKVQDEKLKQNIGNFDKSCINKAIKFYINYLSHALQNGFYIMASYETLSSIDTNYLSERLIDTKIQLIYLMEEMDLPLEIAYSLIEEAEKMVYGNIRQDNPYDWKAYIKIVYGIDHVQIIQWIDQLKKEGVLILK